MKKLEDIPKKDPFNAPEGYFEALPGRISTRIEKKTGLFERPVFRYSLQYALPAMIIFVLGIIWFSQPSIEDTTNDDLLSSIETAALVEFLADAESTSYEDFLDEVNPSFAEADSLENAVYELSFPGDNIDELLEEFETNNL